MNKALFGMVKKLVDMFFAKDVNSVRTYLQGKKTYIFCAILVLTGVVNSLDYISMFASGEMDLWQLLEKMKIVIEGLAGMSLRAGVSNNIKKYEV